MCPPRAVGPEALVLAYNVTKVTRDSWPDIEATTGRSMSKNSCKKDLSVPVE